ncbi:MAG TPA: maleylpyruvate isomerase family mycothiol-dependent enzyme [Streptosporangiaceae bacterium]|nr:maleylpyruvate isomerase family mycothiol-dependent enzyme [Streptosporangiaceae bacterium]
MTAEGRETVVLPAGLRERVMAASHQVRQPGLAVPDVGEDSPVEAFANAADAFWQMLGSLAPSHWHVPVLRDLDVQGLVGHLTGVERDVQRSIAGDPDVGSADHVQSTQPFALEQAGRSADATTAQWREAVDRTIRLAGECDLDAIVAIHGVALRLRDLLVARTFELWTHENDIRAAVGLPATVPAPSTLRPMTQLATALLPFGAAVTQLSEPISVHLVLTGPGGGTWDVAVGEPARHPGAVGIVTDVVGFCRLFANRVAPSDLDIYVTGDERQAASVLTAAAALALD